MRSLSVARPPVPRTSPALRLVGRAVLIAVLLTVYAYGWQVTQIRLGQLVYGAQFVRPFIVDMVRPDVVTRDLEKQTVGVPFRMGAGPGPAPAAPAARAPHVQASRYSGEVGDEITVTGSGFRKDTAGTLLWQNQQGTRQRIAALRTDAQGAFSVTFPVPETRGTDQTIIAEVAWPVGPLKPSPTLAIVVEKIIETVFLALMGTTIAIVAAIPLSFLGAKNLMARSPVGTAVYFLVRTAFNILRSIEPLILAIVFTVWVGLGPFAGVLALALHSVATLGKLYSEQIESIDPGPIEAITATGASTLQVIRHAVVPQVIPPFIAFTIYRWDTNVRMSTVIGFVGGGGIGFILQQYINLFQYRQAATAVWAITIVVAMMDYFSAWIRERVV